jgi:hypothetical protein
VRLFGVFDPDKLPDCDAVFVFESDIHSGLAHRTSLCVQHSINANKLPNRKFVWLFIGNILAFVKSV